MKLKEYPYFKYANPRILVNAIDCCLKDDSRFLIPFSYYEHFGLMNQDGEVIVEPKFNRILDSCRNENDVVRLGIYYTYGFNRSSEPKTYLGIKWGGQ